MKFLNLLVAMSLFIVATARGQSAVGNLIKVGLETDQDQFIPGEPVVTRIAITNLSGRTLNFRGGDQWLNLTVLDSKNIPANKLDEVSIKEDFSVANGEIARIPVDVCRYFELVNAGRYSIRAIVSVRDLGDEVSSDKPRAVEIVRGTVLWEQEFGLPGGSGAPPEARKIALQQAPTGRRKELNLYVRISSSSESRILKAFPISRLLGFSKPEAQIDSACNFHVLNQNGQRSFDYFVIDPDGKILLHQTHEYSDSFPSTRPRLGRDSDGKILVLQGQRRFTPNDIPSNPKPASNATGGP